MGLYTDITRQWLERRFARRSPSGVYFAHMPIYGWGHPDSEAGHLRRLARLSRILHALDGLEFQTLLDIGGAEGYLSHLTERIFGARAASCDLSVEACRRARELFGLPGVALDASRLPFADGSFDVVVCSEVLEHVESPVATVLELQRVASKAVILTTEEVNYNREFIDEYLFRRPGWPHMERNLFHPDDIDILFPGALAMPQCDAEPEATLDTREAARAWILAHTRAQELTRDQIGVVIMQPLTPGWRRQRRFTDAELLDRLFETTIPPGQAAPPSSPSSMEWFLRTLRDPVDRSPLTVEDGRMRGGGGRTYPIVGGVADLVPLTREPIKIAERLMGVFSERAAALTALHERLALPDSNAQDKFDFRRREDRRGFWACEQLEPRSGGGGFHWVSKGSDPWILTPCLQRPVREVVLEMSVHNPSIPIAAGVGQVFWKGPNDDSFGEDRCVKFAVPNDGRVHTHRIVLAGAPKLPATIQWLRLDLVDGPCEIDLWSLQLA